METVVFSDVKLDDKIIRADADIPLDAQLSSQLNGCFVKKNELSSEISRRIKTVPVEEFDPSVFEPDTYYFITREVWQ